MTPGLSPVSDPGALLQTRASWHLLAEHVLAAARYAATGRIGLEPAPGGFATPPLPDGRVLAVSGLDVVDGGRRQPITTGGDAAAFFGTPFGLPDGIYAPIASPREPDRALVVEPGAAALLGDWFRFGAAVLRALAARRQPDEVVTLWPEHFDLGLDLGDGAARATYGASPGDEDHPDPYLYVAPWAAADGDDWNDGRYASLPYSDLVGSADPESAAAAFFATVDAVLARRDPHA